MATGIFIGFTLLILGLSLSSSSDEEPTVSVGGSDELVQLREEIESLKTQYQDLQAQFEELAIKVKYSTTDGVVEVAPEVDVDVMDQPITFSNGYYIAGEDFPEGVYDIKLREGHGFVSSSNQLDGGISTIMGKEEGYAQEYKNIRLPEGVELKIDGPTIDLIKKK